MEHHSNIVPWQLACQRAGAEIAYVPVTDEGLLDLGAYDALLARGPKLVGVVHASNVVGTINPIADVAARAHRAGAVVLVDGSQAVPHLASTSPPWTPTSTPGPPTRSTGRPGSGSCTASASCWRPCRPSSAAAT